MRTKNILVAVALTLLLCGAAQAGQVKIGFGGVHADTYPTIRAINEKFIPVLKELAGEAITVNVFDNSQLGGERDLMEQMQAGILQMAYISPVLGSIDPAINILDLPYLFRDEKHVDMVLDGSVGLDVLKDLPAKGLIPLGYFENGFRMISNSKQPINELKDLQGLKIRTPEAPISVAILRALGANVTPLSFAELYSALQQGVVDGQENAYNTLPAQRFFEVQKYLAETSHMWGCFVILASAKWWNTLDDATQDMIRKASAEASVYQRKLFREQTSESKQACIDAGMEITTPDLTEFRAAVTPVYEDFFKEYPQYREVVEQIRGME
ncbi:MAG: TRAP transporter substrate-binding protein [Planctomycetaceae bacterium]|nr:TRAP transporter substrate-binding protein [Planctomycetaceae bacterium]